MKFSFRVSFASTALLLLLLYGVWYRLHQPIATTRDKLAVHGRVQQLTKTKQYFVPRNIILRPVHTTATTQRSNNSHSSDDRESHRVIQQSSADINTLNILDVIDRERRYGVHTKEASVPSFEELSAGLPLKVIVVPHSHNDPGWHKTVDGYFEEQTKEILNNMLEKLQKYPNMTFVWAESVLLSMWWTELSHSKRLTVQRLLRRGQLEIVGGSWIVPDEANPHYFALIDQMIEGHQWLKDNIGIYPLNTWSLDPFGYSSVVAHLHKLAGFENMVILRVNTAVKEYLQSRNSMEFMWRTSWNDSKVAEIMTLMMPYVLYNIKDSCGPDPKICAQFDFRKIRGEVSDSRSVTVHSGNVDRLAKLLLRQYQLKARLYRHNVVLVPLGDDFRYDRDVEWDQQFQNYMRLFNHMNSKTEWNVHARFGTVKDYFEAVKIAMAELGQHKQSDGNFLSLTGDFFPYTDRNDEFWTGYFSTRPFAKCLCRELEVFLRSAEILHSLAVGLDSKMLYQHSLIIEKLVNSRRNLALFQHHDGITGTSRSWVADDYEIRLARGLQMSKDVIRFAFGFLLNNNTLSDQPVNVLDPLSVHMLSPNEHLIHVARAGIRLQVFNNVAHRRHELIQLIVNHQRVIVVDHNGLPLVSQITPAPVESSEEEEMSSYILSFIADLLPLSVTAFDILPARGSSVGCSQMAKSSTYNVSHLTKQPDIVLENNYMKAAFSLHTGLLKTVHIKENNHSVHSSLQFMFYTSHRSGAYIFAPAGPAEDYKHSRQILLKVFSGPLFTEVRLVRQSVTHWARIVNCDCPLAAAIELNTVVNMRDEDDKELILRLNSDIHSGNIFYTDQNGFHMMKRRRFSTFPIEANYYPATTVVFIEDDRLRLSLLLSQPVGVSSQTEGSLEVMLDRKLQYDDDRGLGEGILDNKRVFFRHYLLLESVVQKLSSNSHNIMPMPTLLAHVLIHRLRNQPILMLSPLTRTHGEQFLLLKESFSCDTVLVNLRALNSTKASALILHRAGYYAGYSFSKSNSLLECSVKYKSLSLPSLFSDIKFRYVVEKTLSLMHRIRRQDKNATLQLQPMQLRTFEVHS